MLALALGRTQQVLLRSGGYIVLMRGMGFLLLGYALFFLGEGWRFLNNAVAMPPSL